jgi:hypothetical protein
VSDSFLIASILDAIGLFITDTLTYKLAEDDVEMSNDQLMTLKKVRQCPSYSE